MLNWLSNNVATVTICFVLALEIIGLFIWKFIKCKKDKNNKK